MTVLNSAQHSDIMSCLEECLALLSGPEIFVCLRSARIAVGGTQAALTAAGQQANPIARKPSAGVNSPSRAKQENTARLANPAALQEPKAGNMCYVDLTSPSPRKSGKPRCACCFYVIPTKVITVPAPRQAVPITECCAPVMSRDLHARLCAQLIADASLCSRHEFELIMTRADAGGMRSLACLEAH